MKTPKWWSGRGFWSTALIPVSIFYDMANTLRQAQVRTTRFNIPIICVGNLVAGGAGKTPTALYIGRRLKDKGVNAFYLSRGYGGRTNGPMLVNPKKHKATDVGDEPLLLAETLPTVVAADRAAGIQYAIIKGAKAIVMDDGFQNRAVYKNLALLVVDGMRGFGNGRLIPAGPLRERVKDGYKRAHAVLVLNRASTLPPLPKDRPAFFARTFAKNGNMFKGKKIFAFCGLAYPDKFFEMLGTTGTRLMGQEAFPDHYQYTPLDMRKLLLRSFTLDAVLVTTAKDFVRLPERYRESVAVLEMDMEFESPSIFDSVLEYIVRLNETT